MNIRISILITLALLTNIGCSPLFNGQSKGYFTSQISLDNSTLNSTIKNDIVDFIQDYYPVSKTTFYFQLDSSTYAQGVTIEDALRNRGYGISYIKQKGRIPFAYKIDFIEKNVIRATYNIGSSTLSRIYRVNREQQTIPISAFTTRGLKKRIYRDKSNVLYPSAQRAIISIPVLNVRNRPSSKGKIIGKYYKNSIVYVESPSLNKNGTKWSRVVKKESDNHSSNNVDRYIFSRYIKYLD
jgi:hypothetical protein